MQLCKKCGLHKDFECFGLDKQKTDGLNSYCKECIRKRSDQQRKNDPKYVMNYAKAYREQNTEKLRKKAKLTFWRDREKRLRQGRESYYRHKEEIALSRKITRETIEGREKERLRQAEWRRKKPEKFRKAVKKWQQTYKERHNAHQRVHRAIEEGILVRNEKCEECDKKCKTEGHHKNYSEPLIVNWLCRRCHASKHSKL